LELWSTLAQDSPFQSQSSNRYDKVLGVKSEAGSLGRHLELIDCGYKTLPESMSKMHKLEAFRCIGDLQDWSVLSSLTALTCFTTSVTDCGRFGGIPQLRKLVVEPRLDMHAELRVRRLL
jgi:hypothetical protein